VVLAMVGYPGDHGSLDRRRAEDRQQRPDRPLGLEASVREVTMEADRHAQPREHVEDSEDDEVSGA
jgi:hypothetical protein